MPKHEEPTIAEPEEESLLPQWGIAVIVIAMASLLFVVIFGVTVVSSFFVIFDRAIIMQRTNSYDYALRLKFNLNSLVLIFCTPTSRLILC